MKNESWRMVDKGEWWLLFNDAPSPTKNDQGELVMGRDSTGCGYPPTMRMSWAGKGCCLHLWVDNNGQEPNDPDWDGDYLHICNLDTFLSELEEFRSAASWEPADWEKE